jgi:1,4-alpha-glucan branching enzyme
VRHPEHARSLEERWLYEATWECYLPLCDLLDRLASSGVHAPFTLSVSPPLAAMLRDDLLCARFEDHLERLERLVTGTRRFLPSALADVLDFYRRRLAGVRAAWDRVDGDVLGALAAHARAERVELWTSAATHAYLPGLLGARASLRAQLRLGVAAFTRWSGAPPSGLWLPECAFDPAFEPELAAAGVAVTVLDAHGLDLARPRPRLGARAPVLSPSGVAVFARDPEASEDVWSRRAGYPGDPVYRDFYRDLGFDLPEAALDGEVGPAGTRVMTGLKLHRITGPGDAKAAYNPDAAARLARAHARDFVERRARALGEADGADAIVVAPFDAELFGHWWFEGPVFLEEALVALAESAAAGGPRPESLASNAARRGALEVVEPAASTWGEGGFGDAWLGPKAAHLVRHVAHAERAVLDALARARHAPPTSPRGRAIDQALVELLLLEASDFAFMIWRSEMAEYAEARVRSHASRAVRLARAATKSELDADDIALVDAVTHRDSLFADLRGEPLRAAFDP